MEHHDVDRLERRRQALRDVGAKAGAHVGGPYSTSGATIVVCLRPATKVMVRQWPSGTTPIGRVPDRLRP